MKKPVPRRVGVRPPPSGPVLPLILIACGLMGAYFAYELGQMRAGYNRLDSEQRYAALRKELIALEEDNHALRERVALLETSEKIDAAAYGQVEAQLVKLQSKILKQQEDLAFYEGIVAADQTAGLRIQDLELVQGPGDTELQPATGSRSGAAERSRGERLHRANGGRYTRRGVHGP